MTGDQPFSPFINGEIRCPSCKRKRPMGDLLGVWDPSRNSFTVKGIVCSVCGFAFPKSQVGLVPWGSQFPVPVQVPDILNRSVCPFCGEVVVEAPDGSFKSGQVREFRYVKCPGSPLLYRMVME